MTIYPDCVYWEAVLGTDINVLCNTLHLRPVLSLYGLTNRCIGFAKN
jgi:hypothetical protein